MILRRPLVSMMRVRGVGLARGVFFKTNFIQMFNLPYLHILIDRGCPVANLRVTDFGNRQILRRLIMRIGQILVVVIRCVTQVREIRQRAVLVHLMRRRLIRRGLRGYLVRRRRARRQGPTVYRRIYNSCRRLRLQC